MGGRGKLRGLERGESDGLACGLGKGCGGPRGAEFNVNREGRRRRLGDSLRKTSRLAVFVVRRRRAATAAPRAAARGMFVEQFLECCVRTHCGLGVVVGIPQRHTEQKGVKRVDHRAHKKRHHPRRRRRPARRCSAPPAHPANATHRPREGGGRGGKVRTLHTQSKASITTRACAAPRPRPRPARRRTPPATRARPQSRRRRRRRPETPAGAPLLRCCACAS